MKIKKNFDICIVGGAGHIGFPLGLAFAEKKKKVLLLDKNNQTLDLIKKKKNSVFRIWRAKSFKKN